jgi:hypothetical protein
MFANERLGVVRQFGVPCRPVGDAGDFYRDWRRGSRPEAAR